MWQVKIPFKSDIEKEKIILSAYLNNTKGVEELDDELIFFFDREEDAEKTKLYLSDNVVFIKRVEDNINWLSRWKKFHKVIKISPFLIVPAFNSKIEKTEKFRKKIIINPSLAFGTGSHPTTKMCIKFLAEVIEGGEKLLDLGCGSAILAICAEKLGASSILAVDIDEIALKEAEKNIKRNRCKKIKLAKTIGDDSNFDLIVCNILLNTIIELKDKIYQSLKRDGKLILSGILKDQTDEILEAFSSDFKLLRRKSLKDKNFSWASFLFQKR